MTVTCFVSLVYAIYYQRIEEKEERMKTCAKLLAQWTYSRESWFDFLKKEYEISRREYIYPAYFHHIIPVLCLGVIVLPLVTPDKQKIIVPSSICLILLLIILLPKFFNIPMRLNYRFRKMMGDKNKSPKVLISPDGVFLNGFTYCWQVFASANKFKDSEYDEENKLLKIRMYILRDLVQEEKEIRIPVPKGKESEAKDLALELLRLNTKSKL